MTSQKTPEMGPLREFVPGRIWLADYPVRFFAMDIVARTTVVRLEGGGLWVHSPGPPSDAFDEALSDLGTVGHVVAPGTFHYLHVASFKERHPQAKVWICPGIETKAPDVPYDFVLGDDPPEAWSADIDQVLVHGTSKMRELAFLHRTSRTLILTDLLENVGDQSGDVDWMLRFWWKAVFHMWNHPKPAPEYQVGYKDKPAVRRSLERILEWDFERVVIAHGDLVEAGARELVKKAWERPLSFRAES